MRPEISESTARKALGAELTSLTRRVGGVCWAGVTLEDTTGGVSQPARFPRRLERVPPLETSVKLVLGRTRCEAQAHIDAVHGVGLLVVGPEESNAVIQRVSDSGEL